jgi:5-methylcytosine-specific restriction endonuclease McrA
VPLGNQRYRLHVTLPDKTHQKLQEARALMRHQRPDGDLAAILDRALTLLLKDVKKRRFGSGSRSRRTQNDEGTNAAPASRYIPVKIRRRVFRRDEGRCTYVDAHGRRCGAREFLEFHHLDPWARDRHHDADRIVLMCRSHNQRAAEEDYGRVFMEEKRGTVKLAPGGAG